jgi:death-on-curing family protein
MQGIGTLNTACVCPRNGLRLSCGGQLRFDHDDDLYPSIEDKAAALGFSLAQNHPFIDGNKRIAHAAMETFLVLNGFDIVAAVDEQERLRGTTTIKISAP